MATWQPLFTTESGTEYYFQAHDDGSFTVTSFQDVDPILDMNMAMANENDGWSPSKELRRAASIPLNLIAKWKAEEGWDALSPHHHDKLMRRLNDIDYQKLRTAHWNV